MKIFLLLVLALVPVFLFADDHAKKHDEQECDMSKGTCKISDYRRSPQDRSGSIVIRISGSAASSLLCNLKRQFGATFNRTYTEGGQVVAQALSADNILRCSIDDDEYKNFMASCADARALARKSTQGETTVGGGSAAENDSRVNCTLWFDHTRTAFLPLN